MTNITETVFGSFIIWCFPSTVSQSTPWTEMVQIHAHLLPKRWPNFYFVNNSNNSPFLTKISGNFELEESLDLSIVN